MSNDSAKTTNTDGNTLRPRRQIEIAEIIGDMKERIRLLKRVLQALLEDERIRQKFTALFRDIDWNKIKMTKADKYFFRGKYFKVNLDKFDH